MTIREYCEKARNDGYKVALLKRGTGHVVTPYCGIWTYSDNGMADDEIEQLEVDEYGITIDLMYMLQKHWGCYEIQYNEQEKGVKRNAGDE